MLAPTFAYSDELEPLNRNITLADKVDAIHKVVSVRLKDVDRIAAALYDPKYDLVKTFVDSSADHSPHHYEAKLSESRSLEEIQQTGRPRVVNDLAIVDGSTDLQTSRFADQGYGSSYTMPMFSDGNFFGFLFFDSFQKNRFDPSTLHSVDVFGHLTALVIIHELSRLRTFAGAIKAARDLTHHRDMETGAHLDRMAYFARLIARELAPRYGLDDT